MKRLFGMPRFINLAVLVVLFSLVVMSCGSLLSSLSSSSSSSSSPTPAGPGNPSANATGGGSLSVVQGDTSWVGYSWYTQIPSKDFTVVDIVVVRNVDTPTAALMNEASKIKADDIIHVRIDSEKVKNDTVVLAASAVAIKYAPKLYVGGSESGSGGYGSGAVKWSRYTTIPHKDYTVIGIVIVDCKDSKTPSADLMTKAKEMGAHDVINILVDTKDKKVVSASGTAIKYTNAIVDEDSISKVSVR